MSRLFVLASFLCLSLFQEAKAELYTPLTPEEMAVYNQKIINEVNKTNALVTELMQLNSNISISQSAELQVVSMTAQVKQTLANNLLNTPSMQSPVVRDAFLAIMQQNVIEQQNLIQLQALIDSEKAKMQAAAAQEPITQEPLEQAPTITEEPAEIPLEEPAS